MTLPSISEDPRPKDWLAANETRTFLLAAGFLAAVTLAMFADVLFGTQGAVLADSEGDMIDIFIPWRQFGFEELKLGNLALWNPHIFSGAPYMGSFQSALLYPLNFLYLLLPLAAAINWTIALHTFLAGVFMYLWAWHRGLHPVARLLTAVLFMFCGAQFLHICVGHLPHPCVMAWAPLLFLSIDGVFRDRSFGWCLLGALAAGMQVLAGHPQYVFLTATAAVIYSALCLVRARGRWKIVLALSGIAAGGAALSAVQLFTGLAATGQAVRSGGVPYWFASQYPLHPDNFLTMVAPGFFGNMTYLTYWGPGNYWEEGLFVGITGVVLAIYAGFLARRRKRRFSAVMAAICLVLALGSYTPLHRFLYDYVPGFNLFRVMAKFVFPASLFIIMLAGAGLDELLQRRRACGKTAMGAAAVGMIVGAAGLVLLASASADRPEGMWHQIIKARQQADLWFSGWVQNVTSTGAGTNVVSIREAGIFASAGLLIAAGTLLVLAGLLVSAKFSRKVLFGVALLAATEVFIFARTSRATIEYEGPALSLEKVDPSVPQIREFLAGREGDYRILNEASFNSAMVMPWQDIYGYDPCVLKRYVEFLAATQDGPIDQLTQYMTFEKLQRVHSMLRLRFRFRQTGSGKTDVLELPEPMGHLELIRQCRVIQGRDRILAAMVADDFDPRQTVILETPPDPFPQRFGRGGSARIVDSSTDHLTIEADVPAPAILLITDNYAAGWRAVALPGSVQDSYQLLPANYILRAVPLAAGHHRLRVEYSPPAFRLGVWISAISVAAYLALLAWCIARRIRGGAKARRTSDSAALV